VYSLAEQGTISIMTTIYLHGVLGRKFGKLWKLEVSSVAEAIRAIDINLKGKLSEYWQGAARDKKYTVKIGDYGIQDEKELAANSVGVSDIHITPIIKGSKSGPMKILAGIVLIVVGYFTFGTTSAWGIALISSGASLTLGGIQQMLTPIPNFNQGTGSDAASNGSSIFQGNAATQAQGGSVPLVYGKMLVAPMPISMSLVNSDVVTTDTGYIGGATGNELPGGGTQYTPITVDIFPNLTEPGDVPDVPIAPS
jgi:predicted phage tail protein